MQSLAPETEFPLISRFVIQFSSEVFISKKQETLSFILASQICYLLHPKCIYKKEKKIKKTENPIKNKKLKILFHKKRSFFVCFVWKEKQK